MNRRAFLKQVAGGVALLVLPTPVVSHPAGYPIGVPASTLAFYEAIVGCLLDGPLKENMMDEDGVALSSVSAPAVSQIEALVAVQSVLNEQPIPTEGRMISYLDDAGEPVAVEL